MAATIFKIDNGVIQMMANDPRYLTAFPCLKTASGVAAPRKRGCASCGSTSTAAAYNYSMAKQCLAQLRGDNLRKLLKMLDTRQIRITYQNLHGKLVQLTVGNPNKDP